MDFVGPILEVTNCLCQSTSKRAVYVRNLKENLDSLQSTMDQLRNLREDVKIKVELEERQQIMKRTNQVDGWLQKVQEVEAEVVQVLQKGKDEEGRKCFGGCCPKNCWSSYKVGKKVSKMIVEVDKLRGEGHFDVFVNRVASAAVDEMPMEKPTGLDLMLEKVWRCIEDSEVGTIGLFGIGGVGKTTLLKIINNEFCNRSHDFEVVIWVVASQEVNVEKIQEVIKNKLGIPDGRWRSLNLDERATEVYRNLKTKKFVLLLDDIWEWFDLSKAGVPFPNKENESKVIFTTRSEEVCGQMKADERIRVKCLTGDEALNLFYKMVGEDTLDYHQEIRKLAEIVAEKCQGLPLALITIGRAMACRKDPREWKHAIKVLHSYPAKFSGMGDHVFPILKFSYDSLRDDTTKKCFLYCSLIPEDYCITQEELIELWIGEGFLDNSDDIHDGRNKGEYVIGSLKLACLLESGESTVVGNFGLKKEFIWMHDVIRDMALWLACEDGEKEHKILVQKLPLLSREKREEVERISLCGDQVNLINDLPVLPNLLSLFLRNSRVGTLPNGFLQHMPSLSVLDLSNNNYLDELPVRIGELITLRHLNLSCTRIRELPIEIKNLKNLRSLLMDGTRFLRVIQKGLISSLLSLQVFSKQVRVNLRGEHDIDGLAMLEDLECLECINDISICLYTPLSLEKILNSTKLLRCIKHLTLRSCYEMKTLNVSSSSLRGMERLETLHIYHCPSLLGIKVHPEDEGKMQGFVPSFVAKALNFVGHQYLRNLRYVFVAHCESVKHFTWLVYAPSLHILELLDCHSVVELITEDCGYEENQDLFSNLTELYLGVLPNLNCICQLPLLFPSLTKVSVRGCSRLKKLPFDLKNASKLKVIEGERDWWNRLQWESEDIKQGFNSKFIDWDIRTYVNKQIESMKHM